MICHYILKSRKLLFRDKYSSAAWFAPVCVILNFLFVTLAADYLKELINKNINGLVFKIVFNELYRLIELCLPLTICFVVFFVLFHDFFSREIRAVCCPVLTVPYFFWQISSVLSVIAYNACYSFVFSVKSSYADVLKMLIGIFSAAVMAVLSYFTVRCYLKRVSRFAEKNIFAANDSRIK